MNRLLRIEPWILALAAILPSIFIAVWFGPLANAPPAMQMSLHLAEKMLQVVLPVLWIVWVVRAPVGWPAKPWKGVGTGLLFGCAVAILTIAAYHLWFKPLGWLTPGIEPIRHRTLGLGISSPVSFMFWAAMISLANSAMEEYYWRWFIFGRLRQYMPTAWAVLLASLAFAAHHVIVLLAFFGWSWAALVFSAGVAIGGAVWCVIYQRSGSLLGPWLSHVLIDAAIFIVGYDLIFASSASASAICFSSVFTS